MRKCPGRMSGGNLDSVMVRCPDCGRLVEFFTDEPKRRCRCGKLLLRETLPRCADWCPAAAQCLGEAIDPREIERRMAKLKEDPRAQKFLRELRRRLGQKDENGPDKQRGEES